MLYRQSLRNFALAEHYPEAVGVNSRLLRPSPLPAYDECVIERQASIRPTCVVGARSCALLPWFKVGRAPDCHLLLTEGHVSSEHAVIRHKGAGEWVVRDLGSKNGTLLNRRWIGSGDVRLADEDVLAFGDEQTAWVFTSGKPCDVIVVPIGQAEWMAASAGQHLLALPSEESADATLLYRDNGWLLEASGADALPVSDGHTFTLAGLRYRVRISSAPQPTRDARQGRRRWGDVVLRLAVSKDEEEIEGQLGIGTSSIPLPSRVYLYLLVLLGRCRHEDRASGLSPGEEGWRYADDISRLLGVDQQALNVQVHRARKDVAKLGFEDPAGLIERRGMTKQMRLGIPTERVIVTTL